jgi:hypothetical protein
MPSIVFSGFGPMAYRRKRRTGFWKERDGLGIAVVVTAHCANGQLLLRRSQRLVRITVKKGGAAGFSHRWIAFPKQFRIQHAPTRVVFRIAAIMAAHPLPNLGA